MRPNRREGTADTDSLSIPSHRESVLDQTATTRYYTPNDVMPKTEMPSGAITLLILRVLNSQPLHGYAIAQRIHLLSSEVLQVEEGALYPALQKILLKGWVTAEWGVSETNRKVRFYRLTPAGEAALEELMSHYHKVHLAIQAVLGAA